MKKLLFISILLCITYLLYGQVFAEFDPYNQTVEVGDSVTVDLVFPADVQKKYKLIGGIEFQINGSSPELIFNTADPGPALGGPSNASLQILSSSPNPRLYAQSSLSAAELEQIQTYPAPSYITISFTATNIGVASMSISNITFYDADGNPSASPNEAFEGGIVTVQDTTAPIITLLGANPQIIEVGDSYIELGATATDNYDGDLSGSIVIDDSGVNISTVGTYQVTYNVSDSAGNPASEVIRTVSVVDSSSPGDTTPPVITLQGANPQIIQAGGAYVELGATALDNIDGDHLQQHRHQRQRCRRINGGHLPGDIQCFG